MKIFPCVALPRVWGTAAKTRQRGGITQHPAESQSINSITFTRLSASPGPLWVCWSVNYKMTSVQGAQLSHVWQSPSRWIFSAQEIQEGWSLLCLYGEGQKNTSQHLHHDNLPAWAEGWPAVLQGWGRMHRSHSTLALAVRAASVCRVCIFPCRVGTLLEIRPVPCIPQEHHCAQGPGENLCEETGM